MQQIKNIPRTGSQMSYTGDRKQARPITGKTETSRREPFRAVLCEVIRKEVSLCQKKV